MENLEGPRNYIKKMANTKNTPATIFCDLQKAYEAI